MSPRARLFQFAFTVFFASAALMIVEIAAARLLAPYVGVSLYTWTTLIGVLLAGLSLGNWLGGIWVDRGADSREAGITLALSSVTCLASLLLLTWIAPIVHAQSSNLILSSLIYVSVLFFIPAVLLGIVTPLLTALSLKLDTRTGHILGRMHALGALGSIAGTFASGYWLVQYFGTRGVIIGTAIGLFLLAVPFLWSSRITLTTAFVSLLAMSGITSVYGALENPCDQESNYFCIRIVDEPMAPEMGQVRSMVLDHLSHGTNVQDDPTFLVAPYVHAMDELMRYHLEGDLNKRFFFAGGGAYTQPRAILSTAKDADIHVAELDPAVTKLAKEKLYLDLDGITVHHRDARPTLENYPEAHFDVVVGDVFHDISIPYHLVTQEFLQLVKTRLKPDGLYLMNVVDAFPDPQLVKSLVKTAQTQFESVHVWIDRAPRGPQRMTYVISAGDSHNPPEKLMAQSGPLRHWLNINQPLMNSGTPMEELPLLTDNYAPVDRLLSGLLFGELGL